MWEDDEELGEQPGAFKELTLSDGRTHYVESRFLPMLKEWDWQYDPETEQIVRVEDGQKKSLYMERLRWHWRQRQESDEMPVLDRKAIRGTFGHLPTFRTMLALSQRQREYATYEGGYNLPASTIFLAECLSEALLAYFEWQTRSNVWVFWADESGLTPGHLSLQPKGERTYETLGQWMDGEYTGDWQKSNKTATGLAPQTFGQYLQRQMIRVWRELVEEENFGHVKGKRVEKLLREGDRPAFLTVRYARDLMAHYPLK